MMNTSTGLNNGYFFITSLMIYYRLLMTAWNMSLTYIALALISTIRLFSIYIAQALQNYCMSTS